jgi:ribonucleoside-diphosphate reductase beta chain
MKNIKDISLTKKKLFNDSANDENIDKMLLSESSNIFNLSKVRYKWAVNACTTMRDNFWIPEKILLNNDKIEQLSEFEYQSFRYTISFLNALDSLQSSNLPRLSDFFTCSEINFALGMQSFQELIHSFSYTYMLNNLISNQNERIKTYYLYKENDLLLKRNKLISEVFQNFADKPTIKKLFKVLISALILERLYFIHGFLFFYAIYNYKKILTGSKEIIELIHRDENTHGFLDIKLIQQFKTEFPQFVCKDEEIYKIFDNAIESEIKWAEFIYQDKIIGLSIEKSKIFLKFLANKLLKMIGIEPIYKNANNNPYEILLLKVDLYNNAVIKSNFFETTVTTYNMSTVLENTDKMWKKFDINNKKKNKK